MPGAAAAVVGAAVSSAVTGAVVAGFTIGAVTAGIIGAIASFAVSAVISSVFGQSKPRKRDFGGSLQRAKDRTLSIRQPIAAHRVIYGEMRVGGIISFLSSTDNNDKLHQLITIAGHEVNSIGQLYINDKAASVSSNTVTNTNFANNVDVYFGLGTTAGDSALQSALQTRSEGVWTSSHKQSGRAKIYTQFTFELEAFSSGAPNVTAIVQGRKVYDPRDASTAYSNNAALCVRDYLTNTSFGLGEPAARINEASFQTAANVCDENVALSAGGTENRYSCNGTFEASEQPKDIIRLLLSSCAGKLVYQGGEWNIYVGAYVTPTITLDEDDIDGGLQITTQVGRRAIFNTARSVYTDPNNLYQPTDAPVISNSTYITEDQSEVIARDFDFSFTTSAATSQRLAKIELEKVRQQITVLMPVSLRNGMRLQAGDTVSVTNARMGWTSKVFSIEEWSFAQRGDADSPRLGINLLLRETASAVYDWNSGEETVVDPAPNTVLPDPFNVVAPTSLTSTESLFITTNGSGLKIKTNLSWTASVDSFVKNYRVEYKLSSDSTYIELGDVDGGTTSQFLNDIASGTYDFRVKAVNILGTSSPYLTLANEIILGLTANPADVSGLSVVALNNLANISWDLHPDLDVRHGGKIRFRHSNITDGSAQWTSSTDIGAAVAGHNTDTTLPLLAGTYLARAVDSTGNESLTDTSFVITTVPNIVKLNPVADINIHPDFIGTLIGLDVVDGLLKFESITDFDDRTDLLDTWTFFDSYSSGVDQEGSFEFAGADLGEVFTTRITHDVTFNTFQIGDFLDSRAGNIDSYMDFDNAPSEVNVDLFIATTQDEVSGTPTWTDFFKFKTGDFTARGFKFKLVASSDDSDSQFNVSALSINIDMPDRVQGATDVVSGAGTKSVVFGESFFATPSIGITANDLGSGDYFTITNKSATGFDVLFLNSSAVAVSRTFNYQARGH